MAEMSVVQPPAPPADASAEPPFSKVETVSSASIARRLSLIAKRIIDTGGALVLLVLTLPLCALVALAVALDGGPVFYQQDRVGLGGAVFGCFKFRSMIVDAADCLEEYLSYHPEAAAEWASRQKLGFDPRITPVGAFLRRTSLDELPQLINVIKGDMSLVGPRPIVKYELEHLYGPVSGALYTSVRPGITGLWQVSGRNTIGYTAQVAMDDHYVRTWSLWQDIKILLRTPRAVFSQRGAS